VSITTRVYHNRESFRQSRLAVSDDLVGGTRVEQRSFAYSTLHLLDAGPRPVDILPTDGFFALEPLPDRLEDGLSYGLSG